MLKLFSSSDFIFMIVQIIFLSACLRQNSIMWFDLERLYEDDMVYVPNKFILNCLLFIDQTSQIDNLFITQYEYQIHITHFYFNQINLTNNLQLIVLAFLYQAFQHNLLYIISRMYKLFKDLVSENIPFSKNNDTRHNCGDSVQGSCQNDTRNKIYCMSPDLTTLKTDHKIYESSTPKFLGQDSFFTFNSKITVDNQQFRILKVCTNGQYIGNFMNLGQQVLNKQCHFAICQKASNSNQVMRVQCEVLGLKGQNVISYHSSLSQKQRLAQIKNLYFVIFQLLFLKQRRSPVHILHHGKFMPLLQYYALKKNVNTSQIDQLKNSYNLMTNSLEKHFTQGHNTLELPIQLTKDQIYKFKFKTYQDTLTVKFLVVERFKELLKLKQQVKYQKVIQGNKSCMLGEQMMNEDIQPMSKLSFQQAKNNQQIQQMENEDIQPMNKLSFQQAKNNQQIQQMENEDIQPMSKLSFQQAKNNQQIQQMAQIQGLDQLKQAQPQRDPVIMQMNKYQILNEIDNLKQNQSLILTPYQHQQLEQNSLCEQQVLEELSFSQVQKLEPVQLSKVEEQNVYNIEPLPIFTQNAAISESKKGFQPKSTLFTYGNIQEDQIHKNQQDEQGNSSQNNESVSLGLELQNMHALNQQEQDEANNIEHLIQDVNEEQECDAEYDVNPNHTAEQGSLSEEQIEDKVQVIKENQGNWVVNGQNIQNQVDQMREMAAQSKSKNENENQMCGQSEQLYVSQIKPRQPKQAFESQITTANMLNSQVKQQSNQHQLSQTSAHNFNKMDEQSQILLPKRLNFSQQKQQGSYQKNELQNQSQNPCYKDEEQSQILQVYKMEEQCFQKGYESEDQKQMLPSMQIQGQQLKIATQPQPRMLMQQDLSQQATQSLHQQQQVKPEHPDNLLTLHNSNKVQIIHNPDNVQTLHKVVILHKLANQSMPIKKKRFSFKQQRPKTKQKFMDDLREIKYIQTTYSLVRDSQKKIMCLQLLKEQIDETNLTHGLPQQAQQAKLLVYNPMILQGEEGHSNSKEKLYNDKEFIQQVKLLNQIQVNQNDQNKILMYSNLKQSKPIVLQYDIQQEKFTAKYRVPSVLSKDKQILPIKQVKYQFRDSAQMFLAMSDRQVCLFNTKNKSNSKNNAQNSQPNKIYVYKSQQMINTKFDSQQEKIQTFDCFCVGETGKNMVVGVNGKHAKVFKLQNNQYYKQPAQTRKYVEKQNKNKQKVSSDIKYKQQRKKRKYLSRQSIMKTKTKVILKQGSNIKNINKNINKNRSSNSPKYQVCYLNAINSYDLSDKYNIVQSKMRDYLHHPFNLADQDGSTNKFNRIELVQKQLLQNNLSKRTTDKIYCQLTNGCKYLIQCNQFNDKGQQISCFQNKIKLTNRSFIRQISNKEAEIIVAKLNMQPNYKNMP